MATSNQIVSVVQDNLHLVFGEPDAAKRQSQIKRLWSSSEDSVFVDPDNVFRGHAAIDDCVSKLQVRFPGWKFKELGRLSKIPIHSPILLTLRCVRTGSNTSRGRELQLPGRKASMGLWATRRRA